MISHPTMYSTSRTARHTRCRSRSLSITHSFLFLRPRSRDRRSFALDFDFGPDLSVLSLLLLFLLDDISFVSETSRARSLSAPDPSPRRSSSIASCSAGVLCVLSSRLDSALWRNSASLRRPLLILPMMLHPFPHLMLSSYHTGGRVYTKKCVKVCHV
jgi:hypothetical protein